MSHCLLGKRFTNSVGESIICTTQHPDPGRPDMLEFINRDKQTRCFFDVPTAEAAVQAGVLIIQMCELNRDGFCVLCGKDYAPDEKPGACG